MPGTITHNYILFDSLEKFTGSQNSLIGRIQHSQRALMDLVKQEVIKKADYKKGFFEKEQTFKPKSDRIDQFSLAGCAYLGCCGPDLFYLDLGSTGTFIADLLHYNRSGLYMVWWLSQIKTKLQRVMNDGIKDLKVLREYSYCLGHISHIAADITLHPYVNSIVAAYPDNQKVFLNSRGVSDNTHSVVTWKFHNILEHHQDSYVLHKLFFKDQLLHGNGDVDWESVNAARWAAILLQANKEYFFVNRSKQFYDYGVTYGSSLETDKHKFFLSDNYFLNVDAYYTTTIPNRSTVVNRAALVQPKLLEEYIGKAVAKTLQFWNEAENYIAADLSNNPQNKSPLELAKPYFPSLRRHWNLDCGLAPMGDGGTDRWDIAEKPDTTLIVAGSLGFDSSHGKTEIEDLESSPTAIQLD